MTPHVRLTLQQVGQLLQMLGSDADEDERLLVDALEGETDVFETIRKLLDGIEQDESDMAGLKVQMDARKARSERCDMRINTRRAAIVMLMKAAHLKTAPLIEATISLGETKARLVVNDVGGVPRGYQREKLEPDMDAIKSAFTVDTENLPNWLRVEPPKPSLTIRRK